VKIRYESYQKNTKRCKKVREGHKTRRMMRKVPNGFSTSIKNISEIRKRISLEILSVISLVLLNREVETWHVLQCSM